MAKETGRARLSLLLFVVAACAQGVDAVDAPGVGPSSGAGASGALGAQAGAGNVSATGGSGAASSSAGSANGGSSAGSSSSAGSTSVGGTTNGGGGSKGSSGSTSVGGSASGGTSAAGSPSIAGSANGGSSVAGASSAGSGGSSVGSAGSAGSGGTSAAPCSGKKPEASCTCQSFSSHDYWFCPTARDFATGEANCVSAGLHLAHVTSLAEDKWINDAANAASFGEYWLGSTDASTPNTWTWLAGGTFWTGVANGTASGYAHWNSGEPNASGDCLVVQTGFAWDDRICTDQRKYICD